VSTNPKSAGLMQRMCGVLRVHQHSLTCAFGVMSPLDRAAG